MSDKKLLHHQELYLIKIINGKALFEIISYCEPENKQAGSGIYLKYNGEITNDIILGLTLNHTEITQSDIKGFIDFNRKLNESVIITESELLPVLPITVHGEYGTPF